MRPRSFFLVVVALGLAPALAAHAGLAPYVRVAYGGGQLKMSAMNTVIDDDERALNAAGYPASLMRVPPSKEFHTSAGVWLFPAFRIGGLYSRQSSFRKNRYHPPGFFYEDQLTFRMEELGAEAAIRVSRLAGFSVGGEVAQGRAKFIESFGMQDPSSYFGLDGTAEGRKTTWGGFVGLEQTTEKGLSGYLRFGYRSRDMGSMPGQYTTTDGVTTVQAQGNTVDMDYSGYYFRIGMGFDLLR